MAAYPQQRRMYPRGDVGQRAGSFAQPQQMSSQVRHPAMLPQAAASAFRLSGVPPVPLEHRFVPPPGNVPSAGQKYYQQQQIVPSKNTGEHLLHSQQPQQHAFPGVVHMQQPQKKQLHNNQLLSEMHLSGVRQVETHQYPQRYQTLSLESSSEPEALHHELRMLHALHYQDKLPKVSSKRSELAEAEYNHQVAMSTKYLSQRSQINLGPVMQNREHVRLQNKVLYQDKHALESKSLLQDHAKGLLYRQHEELYRSRKKSVIASPPYPNRTPPECSPFTMEVRPGLPSIRQPSRQSVQEEPRRYFPVLPQSRAEGLCGSRSTRQLAASQAREMKAHTAPMISQPIEEACPEIYQNPSAFQRRRPIINDNRQVVNPGIQPQPETAYHQAVTKEIHPSHGVSYRAKRGPTMQLVSSEVQVVDSPTKKPFTGDQESDLYSLNMRKGRTDLSRVSPSLEGSRLSKLSVSIKQEQMFLKEELELSLQKASTHASRKEHRSDMVMKNESSVSSTTGNKAIWEANTMPKIIEVRSLAKEQTPVSSLSSSLESIPSKTNNLRYLPTNVNDTVVPKPKSVMIRAHQESHDNTMTAHRVPSRSSMDSESGRKDSWDSGIESPPWPEGLRENSLMYVKRPTSFSSEGVVPMPVTSPQLHQNVKQDSLRLEQSCSTPGLDFSRRATSSFLDVQQIQTINQKAREEVREEGLNVTAKADVSKQQQNEKKTSEAATLKRSWPHGDDCPLATKVATKEEHAIDYSKPHVTCSSTESGKNTDTGIQSDSQEDENFPLDLTVKKEQATTIHSASNDETCSSQGEDSTRSENQFRTIMMRVLRRLWSENKFSSDESNCKVSEHGEVPRDTKQDVDESSDEDSGKYFKPSSVTTMQDILEADSADDRQQQYMEQKKPVLSSRESIEFLEKAICDLMHHSSDAIKHGGDIFHHFDIMIKKELMLEMEKQIPNRNITGADSGDISEAKAVTKQPSSGQQNFTVIENQSNEADALQSNNPNGTMRGYEYNEDSEELVIVENSLSPKVSPDSQETKHQGNNVLLIDVEGDDDEQRLINEMEVSKGSPTEQPQSVYEKAARDAAEKAARIAAENASRGAGENMANAVAQVLSSPREQEMDVNDYSMSEIIDVQAGLSPCPVPPSNQRYSNNGDDMQHPSSASLVSSSGQVQDNPDEKHEVHSSNYYAKGDAYLNRLQRQFLSARSYSEPMNVCRKDFQGMSAHESPKLLQGTLPEEASSSTMTYECKSKPYPKEELNLFGRPYKKIAPSTWKSQGVDATKMKIVKVSNSTSLSHSQSTPSITPEKDMQGQFQSSPIVLLPKIVCIPGQTYASQPSSVPMVQTAPTGNIVLIQQEVGQDEQQQQNPVSVVKTSAVVQGQQSSAVQLPVLNLTIDSGPTPRADSNRSSVPNSPPSPSSTECVVGPFRMIRRTSQNPPSTKKPFVNAYIIMYRSVSLPGVVRSGVPFVPPKMLQEGLFPEQTFDSFCQSLQECNIMQRYMTVLERAALLPDLRHNRISSCKLVSLDEFHQKFDSIMQFLEINLHIK